MPISPPASAEDFLDMYRRAAVNPANNRASRRRCARLAGLDWSACALPGDHVHGWPKRYRLARRLTKGPAFYAGIRAASLA